MGQQADQIRNGDITFQEKLAIIAVWVEQDKALWDTLTALRGPDFPSEVGDGSGVKNANAYDKRRKRKYATTEIIRAKSGLHGGAARYHAGDHVTVPPTEKWDHFDRHVVKAAQALGIKVVVEGEQPPSPPPFPPPFPPPSPPPATGATTSIPVPTWDKNDMPSFLSAPGMSTNSVLAVAQQAMLGKFTKPAPKGLAPEFEEPLDDSQL